MGHTVEDLYKSIFIELNFVWNFKLTILKFTLKINFVSCRLWRWDRRQVLCSFYVWYSRWYFFPPSWKISFWLHCSSSCWYVHVGIYFGLIIGFSFNNPLCQNMYSTIDNILNYQMSLQCNIIWKQLPFMVDACM